MITAPRTLRAALFAAALLLLGAPFAYSQRVPAGAQRHTLSLDGPWQFTQSDPKGAEAAAFDATTWATVTVPHDWAIAGPLDKANPTGQGGAYAPSGVAWYRRTIDVKPQDARRHAFIVFDGIMANSDVWLNGFHLGQRPNGTVPILYDLTGHLMPGKNVLAVRTDTSKQPANRWYEGNGIYRSAHVVFVNDVHIAPWGVVVSTPQATANTAVVHVQVLVQNDSAAPASPGLRILLRDAAGKPAGQASLPAHLIATAASAAFAADIPVSNPSLWSLDHPTLYTATAEVVPLHSSRALKLDADTIPFGIREFHFDPNQGFFLNGQHLKLKGTALHIDGGAVGIAVPDAVYEHRLRALKALGVNAIRTAHNPPSAAFLDLCDRLGLLVMEEFFDQWTVAKNPYDYHLDFRQWATIDERDAIRRDRNHPSIILWSVGNEIHDTPHPEIAFPILKSLVAVAHEEDPTRPVTQALFRPNVSHDYDNGFADLLDVVGQNYRENEILAAHDSKPTRKIIGTENGPDRVVWLAMRDHPAYAGQFLWTGVDYLGEAGEAGGWPIFVNGSGLLDRTGYPRARGYERQSWWSTQPNIHIVRRIGATEKLSVDPGYENAPARFRQVLFPDWTPQNTSPHDEQVEVYTNAEEADLLLNGTSLGRQKLHPDAGPLTWNVPFAPGTLEAVAYTAGKETARDTLRTATNPTHLALKPEYATVSSARSDLVYVEVTLRNAANTILPDSLTKVQFSITGPGLIVATDNGNNADQTPFASAIRPLFQGRAVVLVRASAPNGQITLTATTPNLPAVSTTLQATPPK